MIGEIARMREAVEKELMGAQLLERSDMAKRVEKALRALAASESRITELLSDAVPDKKWDKVFHGSAVDYLRHRAVHFIKNYGEPERGARLNQLANEVEAKLRVHLKGFGEITMPEITFQDWERDVLIQPGKQAAVKSMVVKYSNSLQEIIEVLHVIERLDFPKGNNVYKKEHQISFQDRKGNPVTLALSVEANASPEQARLSAVFLYNGQEQRRNFICAVGKEETVTINAGVTALVLTLDFQGTGYCRILYDIERTDVTDAEFKK